MQIDNYIQYFLNYICKFTENINISKKLTIDLRIIVKERNIDDYKNLRNFLKKI